MILIKQSTAFDDEFFLHDANGDAVTGKVDGDFTKRISKAGAAWGAMTVTITERENGWYHYQISTSHSDTLGLLCITFTVSGGKQVNIKYRVHVRLPDDLAYPATSGRSLQVEADGMVHSDLKEWLGTAPLALLSQRVRSYVGAMAANVITSSIVADGTITAAKLDADCITVDKMAPGCIVKGDQLTGLNDLSAAQVESEVNDGLVAFWTSPATLVDLIWDEVITGHATADSFGLVFDNQIDGLRAYGDTNWATAVGFSTHSAADVWAVGTREITGGTIDTNNDKTGYALSAAGVDAIWDEVITGHATADSFGKVFDDQIDGLRAYGDGAWATAVGFSTHSAADVWTSGTRTLTALGFVLANTDAAWVDSNDRVDVGLWLGAAPNALQSGRVDAYAGAMAAGVIVAATFGAGAVDAAALNADAATEIADALLNRDMSAVSVTNTRSPINALRLLRNKWSISGTTLTVTEEDDSTSAWTSVVGTDPAADPVVSSDPA